MFFQLLFKLHRHHYESYPLSPLPSEAYTESRHDHLTVGIGCGPGGNNCAVEGSGQRGPGPIPLPGKVRAKFTSGSGSHDARRRAAPGSIYDLSAARAALRSSGGSSSSTGSSLAPPHTHGFGSSAYSASHTPIYSLSSVHIPRVSASNSPSGGESSLSHSNFFGVLSNPKPTADVSAAWGRSGEHQSAAQFSSIASMIPQSANSTFHLSTRHGVVDLTSVAVRGGDGGGSSVGVGHLSWNSAKLMDKNYNLLVKPKTASVSDAWGQSVPNGQFSSASMLPQSANSSFHFGLTNGVVDMSTVAVTSSSQSMRDDSDSSGRGASHYARSSFDSGRYRVSTASGGRDTVYAALGTHGAAHVNSGNHRSLGRGGQRGGYSWSTRPRDSSGMGDWLIAPEVAQWLPEGIGTLD
jgi:hypothetical protein